jgi:hypothetical protein
VAKEFRYLRILKVRTAVYEGFTQGPKPPCIPTSHLARVSSYTSSCDFAEACVFSKQSAPPMT